MFFKKINFKKSFKSEMPTESFLDESPPMENLHFEQICETHNCNLPFIPQITILFAALVTSSPPTKLSCQFRFHINMMLILETISIIISLSPHKHVCGYVFNVLFK